MEAEESAEGAAAAVAMSTTIPPTPEEVEQQLEIFVKHQFHSYDEIVRLRADAIYSMQGGLKEACGWMERTGGNNWVVYFPGGHQWGTIKRDPRFKERRHYFQTEDDLKQRLLEIRREIDAREGRTVEEEPSTGGSSPGKRKRNYTTKALETIALSPVLSEKKARASSSSHHQGTARTRMLAARPSSSHNHNRNGATTSLVRAVTTLDEEEEEEEGDEDVVVVELEGPAASSSPASPGASSSPSCSSSSSSSATDSASQSSSSSSSLSGDRMYGRDKEGALSALPAPSPPLQQEQQQQEERRTKGASNGQHHSPLRPPPPTEKGRKKVDAGRNSGKRTASVPTNSRSNNSNGKQAVREKTLTTARTNGGEQGVSNEVSSFADSLVEMTTNPKNRAGVHRISELLGLTKTFQSVVTDIQNAPPDERRARALVYADYMVPAKNKLEEVLEGLRQSYAQKDDEHEQVDMVI